VAKFLSPSAICSTPPSFRHPRELNPLPLHSALPSSEHMMINTNILTSNLCCGGIEAAIGGSKAYLTGATYRGADSVPVLSIIPQRTLLCTIADWAQRPWMLGFSSAQPETRPYPEYVVAAELLPTCSLIILMQHIHSEYALTAFEGGFRSMTSTRHCHYYMGKFGSTILFQSVLFTQRYPSACRLAPYSTFLSGRHLACSMEPRQVPLLLRSVLPS
jgi:hypothetical protein